MDIDKKYAYAKEESDASSTMQSVDYMPLYPHTGYEATKRGNYLHAISEDFNNDLTMTERINLAEEAMEMYNYASWKRGYSDITRYPTLVEETLQLQPQPENIKKYEDYFLGVVPGERLELGIDEEDDNIKRNARIKKTNVTYDLVTYYRYSPRMLNKKISIIKALIKASIALHVALSKYPKNAIFMAYIRDERLNINHKILVSKYDLISLDKTIERSIDEIRYIVQARSIRSYYGSRYPLNFRGQHSRIILTDKALNWISEDPSLRYLRNYISDPDGAFFQTWSGSGRLTVKGLDTVLRISLIGRGQSYKDKKDHTRTRYLVTDTMTEKLGITGYIDSLRIRPIIKIITRLPQSSKEEDFYNEDYTDIKLGGFVEEMSLIQEYSDLVFQPILEEKKEQRKVDAAANAARKRLKIRQEKQLKILETRNKLAR